MKYAGLVILIVCGCIVPPPVAIDEQINSPPVVDYASTSPTKGNITYNRNCRRCTVTVQVTDPDPEPIYARLFYNFENRETELCNNAELPPGQRTFECDIDLSRMFQSDEDGSTHALEMWITDKPFVGTGARGIDAEARYTVIRWAVTGEHRGVMCDDRDNLDCGAFK